MGEAFNIVKELCPRCMQLYDPTEPHDCKGLRSDDGYGMRTRYVTESEASRKINSLTGQLELANNKLRKQNNEDEVKHAGFLWFMSMGLGLFVVLCIFVSWLAFSLLGTTFSLFGIVGAWLSWVSFSAYVCLYVPIVTYPAVKEGVFKD